MLHTRKSVSDLFIVLSIFFIKWLFVSLIPPTGLAEWFLVILGFLLIVSLIISLPVKDLGAAIRLGLTYFLIIYLPFLVIINKIKDIPVAAKFLLEPEHR